MTDVVARVRELPPGEALLLEAPAGEGWRVLNTLHEALAREGLAATVNSSLLVGIDTLTRRVCDIVRVTRVVVG